MLKQKEIYASYVALNATHKSFATQTVYV
jgi:hypothetical protein